MTFYILHGRLRNVGGIVMHVFKSTCYDFWGSVEETESQSQVYTMGAIRIKRVSFYDSGQTVQRFTYFICVCLILLQASKVQKTNIYMWEGGQNRHVVSVAHFLSRRSCRQCPIVPVYGTILRPKGRADWKWTLSLRGKLIVTHRRDTSSKRSSHVFNFCLLSFVQAKADTAERHQLWSQSERTTRDIRTLWCPQLWSNKQFLELALKVIGQEFVHFRLPTHGL